MFQRKFTMRHKTWNWGLKSWQSVRVALSLSCHLPPNRALQLCQPLLPTHAAALFIDGSRAPGSCESLSAFFPTLALANSSEDSPNGRGADRWLDNTPAGRQSRAAQSALQGQTTKRSERPRCAAPSRRSDKGGGNALDVCLQLYTELVKNVEMSPSHPLCLCMCR